MTHSIHPLHDSTAFTELFEIHHLAVFRYTNALLGGSLQEAEDLTAETFLRAWKSRHRFEGDQNSALGWLLTIARHLVIDSARRKKVRQVDTSIADIDEWQPLHSQGHTPSAEHQAIHREQVALLFGILSTLPADRRELLVLRYILGWQVKQIASHLGMVENTASVYIHRAIEQIRRDWPSEDL